MKESEQVNQKEKKNTHTNYHFLFSKWSLIFGKDEMSWEKRVLRSHITNRIVKNSPNARENFHFRTIDILVAGIMTLKWELREKKNKTRDKSRKNFEKKKRECSHLFKKSDKNKIGHCFICSSICEHTKCIAC